MVLPEKVSILSRLQVTTKDNLVEAVEATERRQRDIVLLPLLRYPEARYALRRADNHKPLTLLLLRQ